jgi:hypothetical protein
MVWHFKESMMLTEISGNGEVESHAANSVNNFNVLIRLDKPSDVVKSLEAWYASDFERRITELTELLQIQITQQMREQFVSELESRVESLRGEYEARMDSQFEKWESDRKAMQEEMENLRKHDPVFGLRKEIDSTEAILREKDVALRKMMSDDSLPLGSIMEVRVERAELMGYLKALNFRAAGGEKPESAG